MVTPDGSPLLRSRDMNIILESTVSYIITRNLCYRKDDRAMRAI